MGAFLALCCWDPGDPTCKLRVSCSYLLECRYRSSTFQCPCQHQSFNMTSSSPCSLLRSGNRVLTRNLSLKWCLYGRRRSSCHSFPLPSLRVPTGSVPAVWPRLLTQTLAVNSIPFIVRLTLHPARMPQLTMYPTLLLV